MKYLITVFCLLKLAAAAEQKPLYNYFAAYIEEPSVPDYSAMAPQALNPVGLLMSPMPTYDWTSFAPYVSGPFASAAMTRFSSPQQYSNPPPMYDLGPPLAPILMPEPMGLPAPYFASYPVVEPQFPQPVEPMFTPPTETLLQPLPAVTNMELNTEPKIGITFPKMSSIMEQRAPPAPPPALEKLFPEKIGRTYPMFPSSARRSYGPEVYGRPSNPAAFPHEASRLEPIMMQGSSTLGILGNIWKKNK